MNPTLLILAILPRHLPIARPPRHTQSTTGTLMSVQWTRQWTANAARNTIIPIMSERSRSNTALIIAHTVHIHTLRIVDTPSVVRAAAIELRARVDVGDAAQALRVCEVFRWLVRVVAVSFACQGRRGDSLVTIDACSFCGGQPAERGSALRGDVQTSAVICVSGQHAEGQRFAAAAPD